jgi:hypothetical protein
LSYVLLNRFRSLFEGVRYRHRDSSLGDSVAWCLPEDLYALNRSPKFKARVDAKERVLNIENRLRGIYARRGDGTFGEIIPHAVAIDVPGFVVARGPIATVEIGAEVKILANSMIKQIDRVMNDLANQVREFATAGGTPISVGIVGINQADHYISYEGDVAWHTGMKGKKHPIQEAAEAEKRLVAKAAPLFDEFIILRYRAWNEPPHLFEWVNEQQTEMDYGAILTRIIRKYDVRF